MYYKDNIGFSIRDFAMKNIPPRFIVLFTFVVATALAFTGCAPCSRDKGCKVSNQPGPDQPKADFAILNPDKHLVIGKDKSI